MLSVFDAQTTSRSERSMWGEPSTRGRTLRWVVVCALVGSVAWAVAGTIHWPIVGDAPLLHYVCFLMDHGKVPYRSIFDMDMPGTYGLEWMAIHVLGPGALAWRMFDFLLVLICGAAMIAIAKPVDWLAGLFAGSMFALIHFRDGPTHTGQRDLMMTACMLPAVALLFYAVRRGKMWPLVGFGILMGYATIIKPSALLFALAMMVLLWRQMRAPGGELRGRVQAVGLAVAGYVVPLLGAVVYLLRHGALAAFVATCRGIVPYHASLGRPSLAALVVGSFPSVLMAVALPALPVYMAMRAWKSWEGAVLTTCTALGAVHYIVQGKGFPYHRYPTEAFLLLICGMILFVSLRDTGWMRFPALLGVALGALFLGPASAQIACHFDWRNQEFNQMLAGDLGRLGGESLQGKVQCIDTTAGCASTLYNLGVVQATGYLYDCYMFQPKAAKFQDAYREGFWRAVEANPPAVYVVTNQECFTMNRTFANVERWPQFAGELREKYMLVEERTPPHTIGWWRHPLVPFSYRIYVRKQEGVQKLGMGPA